jgi:hypothetical protein
MWSINALIGHRSEVVSEIKAMDEVPEPWKSAIIAGLKSFAPDWNGVRVDAHGHEMQTETPLSPAEVLKLKDPKAPTNKVSGVMANYHISFKAVRLSGGN